MGTEVGRDRPEFLNLVFLARDYLDVVRRNPPPPDPGSDSPATLAFDPYIGRQLQTATPIRIVPPPPFQETCAAIDRFLDGLYEVGLLSVTDQLSIWQVCYHTTLLGRSIDRCLRPLEMFVNGCLIHPYAFLLYGL